jgi:PAS domain S-box-containing protein
VQYVSIRTDITDLKTTKSQLALFAEMIKGNGEPIFLMDVEANYRLAYVNQAACDHWGASAEDLLTSPLPNWLPRFNAERAPAYFAEMVGMPGVLMETEHQLKDGRIVPVEAFINARIIDGKPYIFGSFQDITKRKKAELALIDARDLAERSNHAKSDFLSSMSHELRTPLNAILGFGQVLEFDNELNPGQQESVHEILKGGRHLLKLINEVLDLSKIESGQIDLSLEPVNVQLVLDECMPLINILVAKNQITLQSEIAPLTAVRADHMRFKQVMLNLLSNAIKYNRKGGTVVIGTQAITGNRQRILVTNTGIGISPERIGELFQPFSRLTAEDSGIEGTGIGLTITRRLVELMGGEIGVNSVVGVSTKFWVDLPLETLQHYESDAKTEQPVPQTLTGTHCVLCIDDNPTNLKLIAQILARRSHIHLITTHLPELGIELARIHQPELILLDINMPGMNGYQLLEKLQADKHLQSIPVIALTANAMPRDIERGLVAGFTDYLTKPLEVGKFLKTIDRLIAPTRLE